MSNFRPLACRVIHGRETGAQRKFCYWTAMAHVDLDSSVDVPGLRREDHVVLKDHSDCTLGQALRIEASKYGLEGPFEKATMLTNLGLLGYVFNPLTAFILWRNKRPVAVLMQVTNTFGEQKVYPSKDMHDHQGPIDFWAPKYFYVSPFIPLDSAFHFRLGAQQGLPWMSVESWVEGKKVLYSHLKARPMQDGLLARLALGLTPYLVSFAIHWQALLLWFKGLPFIRKNERPELQTGVHYGKCH